MIGRILKLIVDQNNLAPPKDELSELFNKYIQSDEIDESELEHVTAAKLENMQIYKSDIE